MRNGKAGEDMKSWRAESVERREGGVHGVGLFAVRDIEADELLAIKNGRIVYEQTLRAHALTVNGSHQQITPELHVAGLTTEEVDTTLVGYNHSCEPNAYVDGQIALRAMSNIPRGREITVDYATAFSSTSQAFKCHCGSELCRHHVDPAHDSRNPQLRERYNGYFAHFLAHPKRYGSPLAPLDPDVPTTSWLTTKAQRGDSAIHGLGTRAIAPISAGELMAIRNGTLVTREEVIDLQDIMKGSEVQITDDIFLSALSEEERLATMTGFNHSCDPNAHVSGQIGIFARRDIEPGEEFTVDYATAYVSPTQVFDCSCNAPTCRGRVDTTTDWQQPDIIKRFNGQFADFVQRKVDALLLQR